MDVRSASFSRNDVIVFGIVRKMASESLLTPENLQNISAAMDNAVLNDSDTPDELGNEIARLKILHIAAGMSRYLSRLVADIEDEGF